MKDSKYYRPILGTQSLLYISNWLEFFTLIILFSYEFNYSVSGMTLLISFWILPIVIFSSIAAKIINTHGAKKVMQVGLIVCAITAILFTQTTSLPVVLIVVFFRGIFFSSLLPAENALINCWVDKRDIIKACSYKAIIGRISKIAAPIFSVLLFSMYNFTSIFIISALLYILACLLLFFVPVNNINNLPHREKNKLIPFGILRTHARVYLSTLILLGFILFSYFFEAQLSLLFKQFNYSYQWFALSASAAGLGGIMSMYFLIKKVKSKHLLLIQTVSYITNGFAILFFLLGNLYNFPQMNIITLVLFFYCGITTTIIVVSKNSLMQLDCPPSTIASVSALQQLLQAACLLPGLFVGYILTQSFGMEMAFIIGAIAISCSGMVGAAIVVGCKRPKRVA